MEVGKVEYVIEANTMKLIEAERRAVRSVDNISSSMGKMGKSSREVDRVAKSIDDMGKEAQNAHAPIDKLQKTLLAFGTVTAGLQLANMADDYRMMSERMQMATTSADEYVMVQERLLDTANKAYRSLEEIQEGYITTSGSLRDLGYSTDESLKLMDSLTYAFVKNATSLTRALESNSIVFVTYYQYLGSDTENPISSTPSMPVIGGAFSGVQARFEASFHDLLNTAFPRQRYTSETAPGIQYMT